MLRIQYDFKMPYLYGFFGCFRLNNEAEKFKLVVDYDQTKENPSYND